MIKLKLTFESPVFKEPRRLIWEAPELTIGRSSRCDFVVPLQTLSSHHLTFRGREGRYEVCDAGSRNGTLLDEVRLEPERFAPLRPGMVLRTIDLTIRVELTEEYDAESFTMQTATQAIRNMAQDALDHGGEGQDAYLEVMSGAQRGRRYLLDDRLQRAFVGGSPGALIRLHEAGVPGEVLILDRTEQGFAVTPSHGERVLVDGEVLAGRYELRSRQRLVWRELELYFFDPVEDLMLVLDGVLPPVERVLPDASPEGAHAPGEQGGVTPESALEGAPFQPMRGVPAATLPGALPAQGAEAAGETLDATAAAQEGASAPRKSKISLTELLIIALIVIMMAVAIGVIVVFVTA